MTAMPEYPQTTPRPILHQVVGWVVVLPLLVSFLRLPVPLGLLLVLASLAGSMYGVRFARRHASRRVSLFALVVTVLNTLSLFAVGQPTIVKVPFLIAWWYVAPYYSNWVYWNF